MNSINNGWNSKKWAEAPYFFVVPRVKMKISEKGKRKQKQHENG